MHLRSLTIKGFKSFPDRTKLEFTPGVSVIVGPNGSGKSNVTEAVLWAMGEQSPLAVRGQTMQDVIFAGGRGVQSRNAAEVEVVLDNSDGAAASEFSEISITRRLDRSGDGEYRLNGARCRLADVIDAMSDTGLGKEMHSVVSQGRVESIIHSKPRDRRLLIEEAAGLGKHRKRRRRAQLKLERTEANLARGLDVEREARSRLRPLKRQAEAAELHERIERQSLEARLELARDRVGSTGRDLSGAEQAAVAARKEQQTAEAELPAVAQRREQAEEQFAAHSRVREALAAELFAARSAAERIGLRLERARDVERATAEGAQRRRAELTSLEEAAGQAGPDEAAADRVAALQRELETLDTEREGRLERELTELAAERDAAARRLTELTQITAQRREAVEVAERRAEQARQARREAERTVEAARREAASVGAELAAVNQFLSRAAAAPGGARALAEDLGVEPGYELAVAAALGPLLGAGLVSDLVEGERLLDGARGDGAIALIADYAPLGPAGVAGPPVDDARPLLELVRPETRAKAVAERLLRGAWLVDSLEALPRGFGGVAVTRAGRVLIGATGELRQAVSGGQERVLEQRNRRDELIAASEAAAAREHEVRGALGSSAEGVTRADAERDDAAGAARAARRDEEEAAEAVRRTEWLMERRREAPDDGPAAVRRAEVVADLRAEQRLAEQVERERTERAGRIERLRWRIERDVALEDLARRSAAALDIAHGAVATRRDALNRELQADQEIAERTAAELRGCAQEEVRVQSRLRDSSEAVTRAEVRAQQVRDAAGEAAGELKEILARLELEPAAGDPPDAPLGDEARAELQTRIERLARRREQLGPVNPLAKDEYAEAVAHVEELETQRTDLESAMRELEGLIKETDRRIRESFEETFEAAAKNFEEMVGHLFPGGRGRLRLVQPDGPRAVSAEGDDEAGPAGAGAAGEPGQGGAASRVAGEQAAAEEQDPDEDGPSAAEPGVEVEVTPAGKSMKRLSLLSGGEKSLVALAFLFAVFLAKPCPFYVLDEVEAALDDVNIDRFLQLVRRFSDRAQFIIVTHQKRTMDVADCLYGVSMGGDGVSKVISRKLPPTALSGVGPAGEPADSSEAAA
jgi:chromosome segregation protein